MATTTTPDTAHSQQTSAALRRAQKPRFEPTQGFQHALKSRVDEYFSSRGIDKRDSKALYVKAAIIMAWFFASWAILVFLPVFVPTPLWAALLMAASLGLAMAAVGFNIQHDGGHGAFSNNKAVNRVTALTMDLVGASSYIWNYKHNQLHHTYTNIEGHDDDINLGVLGRLCNHQPRLWFHKFQHIYVWFLYGFITPKWHLVDDFVNMAKAKIGDHSFPRAKGWDMAVFLGGKALFFTLMFVIPAFFHKWWIVGLFYLFATYLEGIVLSIVFQLAHVVEEADFPLPDEATNRMENEWMIHQIETTVDFARDSALLNWYVGGLNFQVEHHLFPNISHVHYPELSKIVEQTCTEYGVKYAAHPTFWQSVKSHYSLLKQFGTKD